PGRGYIKPGRPGEGQPRSACREDRSYWRAHTDRGLDKAGAGDDFRRSLRWRISGSMPGLSAADAHTEQHLRPLSAKTRMMGVLRLFIARIPTPLGNFLADRLGGIV